MVFSIWNSTHILSEGTDRATVREETLEEGFATEIPAVYWVNQEIKEAIAENDPDDDTMRCAITNKKESP